MNDRARSLLSWLAFLNLLDCPCRWELRGGARLYGVNMSDAWVRVDTIDACTHHGVSAPLITSVSGGAS